MNGKLLKEIKGDEGMIARVWAAHGGKFSVTLFDSDCGETVPMSRLFPASMKAEAFAFAGTLVAA